MSFGRWPRAAWAALSVASLLLAACSGDDEPPAPLPTSLQVIAPERAEVDQAIELGSNADAGAAGLSHRWEFGDGSTSSEARPHHAYAAAGLYELRLTVRNQAGEQRSARVVVQAGRYARVQNLACSAPDHSGWCWQQPSPRGSGIFDADFADAQQGWSVGEAGLILHTQDGGAHWQAQPSGTQRTLRQVRFLDALVGFAAGDGGTLLRTEDGGQHWTRWWLESADNVSLSRLWVPDARTVVVAGVDANYSGRVWSFVDGKIVRRGDWAVVDETLQLSADGRLSWFRQQMVWVPVEPGSSEGKGIIDSHFYGVDVRRPIGSFDYRPAQGEVIRAAGAGLHLWVMLGSGPGIGHMMGLPEGPLPPDEAPVLATSEDQGATWQRHAVSLPPGLGGLRADTVRIFDGRIGWAWSGSGALLRTDDGGAAWRSVALPGTGQPTDFMMGPAKFFEALLLSVNLSDGRWLSTDGGLHWQPLAPPLGYYSEVHDLRSDRGGGLVSAGDWNGLARRTIDEGRSWQPLGSAADEATSFARREQLWFGDAQHGLHLLNGRLLETRDGGLSWQDQAPELSCDYCGMQLHATRDGTLWRERQGKLARSTDQGRSWIEVPLPSGVVDRYYFAFTSAEIVWAQAPSGVYRSLDGGAYWQMSGNPQLSTLGLRQLAFADARIGVLITNAGELWRSADGGESWQRAQAEAVLPRGGNIYWTDDRRGWIFDELGHVLRTEDAGASWQSATLPVQVPIHGVFFIDAAHGWMVGERGTVLATDDGGHSWVQQAGGTERSLYSVWAIDVGTVWVAGDGGVLLTTSTGGR